MSYDQMLTDQILVPLAMSHTYVQRTDRKSDPARLTGFDLARRTAAPWNWDVFAPAGGIVSTAGDMMKYLQANIAPSATALGRAMRLSQSQGLGWDSLPGAARIFKNGQTGGFHALVMFEPEKAAGVFVASNVGTTATDSVGLAPSGTAMPDFDGIPLAPAKLNAYLGKYRSTADAKIPSVDIRRPGRYLFAETADGDALRLSPQNETEFAGFDGVHFLGYQKVSFVQDSRGGIAGFILRGDPGQPDTRFKRVQ